MDEIELLKSIIKDKNQTIKNFAQTIVAKEVELYRLTSKIYALQEDLDRAHRILSEINRGKLEESHA